MWDRCTLHEQYSCYEIRADLKFLIITAGGKARKKQLGMGHIFRTLNLVEHLKKNNIIYFLLEDHGGSKEIIEKKKFKTFLFGKNSSVTSQITVTKEIILKYNIDVVIIDWNNIKKQFIHEIRKYTKTVFITDMKNKDIDVDMVVNGFIGFKNTIIKNKYNSKCLLGPRFQILHNEFSKTKKYHKKNNVLITFGGFDENNIIEFVLNNLTQNKKIKAKVILGPATTKTKKIYQIEKKLKETVEIINKTENMCKEIKMVEIGICSGGLTSYEFAACGIPFIIICQVKHQLLAAREWEKKKVAINLGLFNEKSKENLIKIIKELPLKKLKSRKLVDGNGGKRVAYEINKYFHENSSN